MKNVLNLRPYLKDAVVSVGPTKRLEILRAFPDRFISPAGHSAGAMERIFTLLRGPFAVKYRDGFTHYEATYTDGDSEWGIYGHDAKSIEVSARRYVK